MLEESQLQVDYQKYTLELVKLDWLVQIHDGDATKYVPTKLGIESISSYRLISQNTSIEEPISEQLRWMIKNAILVKHFDMQGNSETLSTTPYGFGLFHTMEYWLNEKLQQRLDRRKKLERFAVSAKKGLDLFIKYTSANKTSPKFSRTYSGGARN